MEDNIYSRRMHKGDQDRGKVVSQRRTDFQKCQLHFSIRRVYIIAFGNAILATIYAPAALRFPRTVALLFSINRILAFLNAPTKTRIFLCSAFLRFPLIAVKKFSIPRKSYV